MAGQGAFLACIQTSLLYAYTELKEVRHADALHPHHDGRSLDQGPAENAQISCTGHACRTGAR
jgi:hypothetical protein